MIYVSAVLDEELAQLPMPMESRTIQVEVVAERIERFTFGEQEWYGTNVARSRRTT
jgi:hypothetical protein